jgi:arabinogalactan oligomer/maltooligosaccharide transport system substrate-binding protein
MKKNLLIAAIMVASMGAGLASCGTSSSVVPPAPTAADAHFMDVNTPIVVWAPSEEQSTIQAIVDAYNNNQAEATSKFSYTFTGVSESDGGTTLATDPTVAKYPSLVAVADDQINNLVTKGDINPLGGAMLDRVTEFNTEFSVKCVTNGGKVYGFPITADNGYFMWYDKALAGDTDMTDFAAILAAILAAAKKAGKKVAADFGNGWYASQFFFAEGVDGVDSMSYNTNADGKLFYNINWDNAAGVEMATKANELLQQYYEDGTLVIGADATNAKIQNGFNNGTYFAAESGLWMEKLFTGNDHMGACELPKIDGHHLGSFSGAKAFVVNAFATAGEQRAAFYLGDLLTRKDSQLTRFVNRNAIPCNSQALLDPSYKPSESIQALTAQNNYAAIQSSSAESRYWDRGQEIGQAICDGDLGKDANDVAYTWQTFLTAKCDMLRAAS